MTPKTSATLGELRAGDRFYFCSDKKNSVYQVTKKSLFGKPFYNYFNANGNKIWPFDKQADAQKPVVFLRHTHPAAGEECTLEELVHGDVFYLADNIIKEYLYTKDLYGWAVKPLNATAQEEDITNPLIKVVFVKTLEEENL